VGNRPGSLGVKCLGHGIDHPLPFNAKCKEKVELYLYAPSQPSWPVPEQTLSFI